MEKKVALVFGSTGLIGNLLLEELIRSDEYSLIKTFVRYPIGITEPKVEENVVDFSDPGKFSPLITGDVIFICLGSTIRKAGSVANMEKIDRDLPVNLASIASANGVKKISAVSSIGANPGSANYYLRIKGEMEDGIRKLDFRQVSIVRPSMLLGERKEWRTGEIFGKAVIKTISPLLLGRMKKYRGIHARDVARAMIYIIKKQMTDIIYESDELKRLADLTEKSK